RQDDLGVLEVMDGVQLLPEGERGPLERIAAPGRLVLIPLRLREALAPRPQSEPRRIRRLLPLLPGPLAGPQGSPSRPGGSARQHAHSLAALLRLLLEGAAQGGERLVPGPRLTEVGDRLRPLRVVQAEDRRLRERVGGAEAGGVARVALDLGRPALVSLDEQP